MWLLEAIKRATRELIPGVQNYTPSQSVYNHRASKLHTLHSTSGGAARGHTKVLNAPWLSIFYFYPRANAHTYTQQAAGRVILTAHTVPIIRRQRSQCAHTILRAVNDVRLVLLEWNIIISTPNTSLPSQHRRERGRLIICVPLWLWVSFWLTALFLLGRPKYNCVCRKQKRRL